MGVESPRGEGTEYTIYPPETNATSPQAAVPEVGELLYKSIDVPREDKPARYRQHARNFPNSSARRSASFFSIDRALGASRNIPIWAV